MGQAGSHHAESIFSGNPSAPNTSCSNVQYARRNVVNLKCPDFTFSDKSRRNKSDIFCELYMDPL